MTGVEIVIGLVVVIALLIALGVNTFFILEGVLVLLLLVLLATLLFFVYTAFSFIGSERIAARFDRIEKPEGKAFSSAVYISDGEELRNTFPNEAIFKKRLYDKSRVITLIKTRKGKIYDRYSIVTVAAGLVLGTASMVLLGGWSIGVLI